MKIVFLLGTDGADVRSIKTCRSLVRLGHEVHFVGWNRREEAPICRVAEVNLHLMQMPVPHGRSTVWGQLKFAGYAAGRLRAIRPDVVCAINEDNVLRAAPFKRIFFDRLVCDFYDSHADRFSNAPFPIRWLVNGASSFCKSISDRLTVTDTYRWARLGKYRSKATIVQNVPEDPGEQLSLNFPQGPTKIFVTGAMSKRRGLKQILEAVERSPEATIVAAGMPSDEFAAETFIKHQRVDYRGVVTPAESLELASHCDAVFAFYEPSCENHLFASPNKLFDGMSVGRPVIINSEVKMSELAERLTVGLLCEYNDAKGLQAIVESLPNRRRNLPEFAATARNSFLEDHSWEKMELTIAELYESLDDSTQASHYEAATHPAPRAA